jgi:hypothetical protein
MHTYFAEFRIVGEVADFLYLQDPGPRLLVDMSIAPAQSSNPMLPPYPHKLATEITNDLMAAKFLREVAVGDVIELTGTFSQDGYSVHDKEFVDTAMTVTAYRALQKPSKALESTFGQLSSFSTTLVH